MENLPVIGTIPLVVGIRLPERLGKINVVALLLTNLVTDMIAWLDATRKSKCERGEW